MQNILAKSAYKLAPMKGQLSLSGREVNGFRMKSGRRQIGGTVEVGWRRMDKEGGIGVV